MNATDGDDPQDAYSSHLCSCVLLRFLLGLVFTTSQGAGGIGAPGTHCKITTNEEAQPIIDEFLKYGPMAIDTSRLYGNGTSEAVGATCLNWMNNWKHWNRYLLL